MVSPLIKKEHRPINVANIKELWIIREFGPPSKTNRTLPLPSTFKPRSSPCSKSDTKKEPCVKDVLDSIWGKFLDSYFCMQINNAASLLFFLYRNGNNSCMMYFLKLAFILQLMSQKQNDKFQNFFSNC